MVMYVCMYIYIYIHIYIYIYIYICLPLRTCPRGSRAPSSGGPFPPSRRARGRPVLREKEGDIEIWREIEGDTGRLREIEGEWGRVSRKTRRTLDPGELAPSGRPAPFDQPETASLPDVQTCTLQRVHRLMRYDMARSDTIR